METKQQFLEEINKVKGSKRDYLNKLFQYVSEAGILSLIHIFGYTAETVPAIGETIVPLIGFTAIPFPKASEEKA